VLLWGIPAGASLDAFPSPWDNDFEDNEPADTDTVAEGDDHIRILKEEVRERMQVEHHFGSNDSTSDDNGLHRVGSARCFIQGTEPTDLDDDVYSFDHDGTTGDHADQKDLSADAGPTAAVCSTDDGDCAANEKLGHGRCWIDKDGTDDVQGTDDDYAVYFYDDTAGFVAVKATSSGGAGPTLLFNGNFEDLGTAATTIPTGWAQDGGTATFTYAQRTDVTDGDGVYVVVSDDGNPRGIKQTLSGLEASTWYTLSANTYTAADTCQLLTTGASTNVDDTSATTAAWEGLYGEFLTDATPTDVVVHLRGNNSADDICRWDQVKVARRTASSQGSPQSFVHVEHVTNATGPTWNSDSVAANLTTDIIAPADGCYIKATASFTVFWSSIDNNDNLTGTYHLRYDVDDAESFTNTTTGISQVVLVNMDASNGSFTDHRNLVGIVPVVAGSTYDFDIYWDYDSGSGDPAMSLASGGASVVSFILEMICNGY
jgi:hypothetical protein